MLTTTNPVNSHQSIEGSAKIFFSFISDQNGLWLYLRRNGRNSDTSA